MKILSNFDTGQAQELLDEAIQQFGAGNALLIRKSKLYFYQYIGFPVFGYLVLILVGSYAMLMIEQVPVEAQWGFWGIVVLLGLLISFKASRRWMDYRMDYLLVTPLEISKYDQSGVLHRDVENIPTNKIKSISVSKHGLLQSMFDIGSIVFLAEGESDEGDITMEMIDAVGHTQKQIKRIMGEGR